MIRAVIVDDEIAAVGNLADLLQEFEQVETVGEFTNPLVALEKIGILEPDVVFLDIDMPGMDGLELAGRLLDSNQNIDVVFVTAFNEYAIEAFELHVLDYLLKPVAKERLEKTLRRLDGRIAPRAVSPGSKLRVTFFGKFKVEHEDGTPVKWRTTKTEELFAYLADKSGASVRRETIVNDIWGHMDDKRASTNFSTCLYYLKKTLSGLGFPQLLIYNSSALKLDMAQISTDLAEFERFAASMDRLDAGGMEKFKLAVAHFLEGYLAEDYFEWAETRRNQLEEACMKLILQAAERELSLNREQSAAELLKLGLARDPLDQELNYALLKLYVRLKDRVAAVKHYEEYKRVLKTELGIPPDDRLKRMIDGLVNA
mgnify:CR=1 FL=1